MEDNFPIYGESSFWLIGGCDIATCFKSVLPENTGLKMCG